MGKTSIEWTDASWNPIVGCTEVSPGCANCYAARLAATRLKSTPAYKGLASITTTPEPGRGFISRSNRGHWTGVVRFLPERLEEPLHWREPRRIFVCDMGDLFHEDVHDKWIKQIWNIMAQSTQHTFQVLTKRTARMRQWVSERYGDDLDQDRESTGVSFAPLPNVWLGTSVENQHFADERIPLLLDTPAAVRWLSCEPLLGPLDLKQADSRAHSLCGYYNSETKQNRPLGLLHWIVAGGESGRNARPMHPDWVRSLRDQCVAMCVPFFFKQWGAWWPGDQDDFPGTATNDHAQQIAAMIAAPPKGYVSVLRDEKPRLVTFKVGKKAAGRLLDGREWNQVQATFQKAVRDDQRK